MASLETGLLAAIIVGLVEAAKRLGCPKKFLPLLAVVLGIILVMLSGWQGWGVVIINGIVSGLAAVGLFSSVRNTYEAIKK